MAWLLFRRPGSTKRRNWGGAPARHVHFPTGRVRSQAEGVRSQPAHRTGEIPTSGFLFKAAFYPKFNNNGANGGINGADGPKCTLTDFHGFSDFLVGNSPCFLRFRCIPGIFSDITANSCMYGPMAVPPTHHSNTATPATPATPTTTKQDHAQPANRLAQGLCIPMQLRCSSVNRSTYGFLFFFASFPRLGQARLG